MKKTRNNDPSKGYYAFHAKRKRPHIHLHVRMKFIIIPERISAINGCMIVKPTHIPLPNWNSTKSNFIQIPNHVGLNICQKNY